MVVGNYIITDEFHYSFYAVADYRGSQVSGVHRFCDIGRRVVDYDGSLSVYVREIPLFGECFLNRFGKCLFFEKNVYETRPCDFDFFGEVVFRNCSNKTFGNHFRCLPEYF